MSAAAGAAGAKGRARNGERGRKWKLTINAGGEAGAGAGAEAEAEAAASLPHWEELPSGWKYVIWQRERGEEAGRLHVQAFVVTEKTCAASVLRKEHGGYWEVFTGPPKNGVEYCTKEETRVAGPYELGELPAMGRPGGALTAAVAKLKADPWKGLKQVRDEEPEAFVRNHTGLLKLAEGWTVHREDRKVTVLVATGHTGCGKSYWAKHFMPKDTFKLTKGRGSGAIPWFTGYEGERCLHLEEYTGWISWEELKSVLEGYPQTMETKGWHVKANWDYVLITSNMLPHEWHPHHRVDFAQLERRIHGSWIGVRKWNEQDPLQSWNEKGSPPCGPDDVVIGAMPLPALPLPPVPVFDGPVFPR